MYVRYGYMGLSGYRVKNQLTTYNPAAAPIHIYIYMHARDPTTIYKCHVLPCCATLYYKYFEYRGVEAERQTEVLVLALRH